MLDSLINPIHILILLGLVVVIFGPRRLPEMGRKIGETLREVNSATSQIRSQIGLDEIAGSVQDIKSTFSLTGGPDRTDASPQGEPGAQGAATVEAGASAAVVAAPPVAIEAPAPPATGNGQSAPTEAPAVGATENAEPTPAASPQAGSDDVVDVPDGRDEVARGVEEFGRLSRSASPRG